MGAKKSVPSTTPNNDELQKARQVELTRYKTRWNNFVRDFIVEYGKIPMPGITRVYADSVHFELGSIEFFEASEVQKSTAKKDKAEADRTQAKNIEMVI